MVLTSKDGEWERVLLYIMIPMYLMMKLFLPLYVCLKQLFDSACMYFTSTIFSLFLQYFFLKKGLYFLGEWNTIKKQGDNTECADSSTG